MRKHCVILILLFALWGKFSDPVARSEIVELPFSARVKMLSGVYSERSEVGDRIEALLLEPVNLKEQRIFVPVNSVFSGRVSDVKEAGRALRRGKVSVHFDTIHYPNGFILYINGMLHSADEGKLAMLSNSRENDANGNKNYLIGKIGIAQKAIGLGKIGAGAILAGPVGAALATGSLVFEKGGKVRINPDDEEKILVTSINFVDPSVDYSYRAIGKIKTRDSDESSKEYYYLPKIKPRLD